MAENYILENDEWKFDIMPEIIDGKNIADFIDPDVEEKLEALEAERDKLKLASEDTKRQLSEKEEDLIRARERLEAAVADLEVKLASEIRNRYVKYLTFIYS